MHTGNDFLYSSVLNRLAIIMRLISWILCFFIVQDVLFDGRRRLSLDVVLIETGGFMVGGVGSIIVDMLRSRFRMSNFTNLEWVGTTFMLMSGGFVLGVVCRILVSMIQRQDGVLYLGHSVLWFSYIALDMACGLPLMRRMFAFDKANCSEKCVNCVLPGVFWLLINITFVILWYAYRYRSEGTYNPGWTYVFRR
jgi:hypothetical protein